ncbi:hypothetical protein GG344DRAFT_75229 [Lentinula edodes]|nr:hypothetical protein GG344DRAFT_75229 [Lentinula edodes]
MLRVTVVVAIIFAVLLGVFSSPITLSPPYDLETQVPSLLPYRNSHDTYTRFRRLALMRWTWKIDMPEWDSHSLHIHGASVGSTRSSRSLSVSKAEKWAICIDIECFVATMNDDWTGVEHFQTFERPRKKTKGYIQITSLQATVDWDSRTKREQCWKAFVHAASQSKDIMEFYNHMVNLMLNAGMLHGEDGSTLKEVPPIWTAHYNIMQRAQATPTRRSSRRSSQ